MRYATAALLAILIVSGIRAQDTEVPKETTEEAPEKAAEKAPKTVTVRSYGEACDIVLRRLADDLGLTLHISPDAEDAVLQPTWIVGEDIAEKTALLLLEESNAIELHILDDVLFASSLDDPLPGATVKGYNVSVLAGSYVKYVNAYGETNKGGLAVDKDTAAERLGVLLDDIVARPGSDGPFSSVVGDRVLFTMDNRRHERVRETLDLLMQEGGGESKSLGVERALFETLAKSEFAGSGDEVPLASILARICANANAPVVLDAEFVESFSDLHIVWDINKPIDCAGALRRITKMFDDEPIFFGSRNGALLATMDSMQLNQSLKVVDASVLLKKLDASYQRQRTAPDKVDGFDGSLRSEGGIDVVLGALYEQLDEGGHEADIGSFGSRILIRGGHKQIDMVVDVLKEMGWEEPEQA